MLCLRSSSLFRYSRFNIPQRLASARLPIYQISTIKSFSSTIGNRTFSTSPAAPEVGKMRYIGLSFLLGVFLATGSVLAAEEAPGPIETYFTSFPALVKAERWDEILAQGTAALEAAKKMDRKEDEAKICAQLTSTAFYQGDYLRALAYAERCYALAEAFIDQELFIRALYLRSAVYRALAGKEEGTAEQQASYLRAVKTAEEANVVYIDKKLANNYLHGKIYFNWGAAHADNPEGDLQKAADCYRLAVDCFSSVDATHDLLRTQVRLGKVYLLEKRYSLAEKVISEARPQATSDRLRMQIDYLEAQLRLAENEKVCAEEIAKRGLASARALGAKQDILRFTALLDAIGTPPRIPQSDKDVI